MPHSRRSTCILAVALIVAGSGHAAADMILRQTFKGMSDASAAIVLDSTHFLLFDDEEKNPYVFDITHSDSADEVKIKSQLHPVPKREFDYEGAALVGDTIVGITSHGRKRNCNEANGDEAPERRRLFAFSLKKNGDKYKLGSFEGSRDTLIEDFTEKFATAEYDLEEAAKHMPETSKGLNIEGMAAWKDKGVIIGLRGPLFGDKALLIPILNAVDYIKVGKADFEKPILISLDGKGIRDIRKVGNHYLIIGGPSEPNGSFALYSWSGNPDDHLGKKLTDLVAEGAKPEALLSMDDNKTVSVLSDDGDYVAGAHDKCTDPDGEEEKDPQFRMFDVPLAP